MLRWTSGLSRLPFTQKIMGSNPIRSTKAILLSVVNYIGSKVNVDNKVHQDCSDIGSVVQLARIHACHAWGRGFESRPNRARRKHGFESCSAAAAVGRLTGRTSLSIWSYEPLWSGNWPVTSVK